MPIRPSFRVPRAAGLAVLVTGLVAAGITGPAPASAAPSTGAVVMSGTKYVPDSYIVVLKDGAMAATASMASTASTLAGRYGGRVGRTYSHALRGFESSMTQEQAKRLAADPAVKYVQRNAIVSVAGSQTNPPSWGLDRIDQRSSQLNRRYTYPNSAPDVRVYVLDTGIRFSHREFGGRATSGFDAIDGETADDCNGHGTHVAGTIGGATFGVAKQVRLVGVRVLDCTGSGTWATLIAGIDWITANAVKPAVVNVSITGGSDVNPALDDAVAASIATGLTYTVAASNNSSSACFYTPARTPSAITVAATARDDTLASFSNFGPCVDISAPGVGITSSWYYADTAANTISGTSMASPHAAGAAALVLQDNPHATPAQVRDLLVARATTGALKNLVFDTPDRLLFVTTGAIPGNDFAVSVPGTATLATGGTATVTINTAVLNGQPQPVTLSATGLPSGVSAAFNPATVTAGQASTLTLTATGTTIPPETYRVTVTGTGASATRSGDLALTVTGGTSSGCAFANGIDLPIPDNSAPVSNEVNIGACDRAPSARSTVEVHAVHTWRGDLVIDLIAPDGTAYRLKESSLGDGTDNVDATYTANLQGETANGTWRLRVQDTFANDTGYLDRWSLKL